MIGKTFAHYEILAKVGAGGMGEVYRARDARLDRVVALKVLPSDVAQDPKRMARFEQEARTLAALNHPNVAAIYGIEEHQGQRCLVIEFADGEDLARRLARGAIPIPETLDLAVQIASGIEEAHSCGIVHRDLKPANIYVSSVGTIKILDFGLAKALGNDRGQGDADSSTIDEATTQPGTILGSPGYMSPEQTRGKAIDSRTDIWAFGCVLYEMLTGRRLFARDTVSDSIGAILHSEPDWQSLPAATPPTVRRLLRRCLAKEPNRRFHHIADVRIELEDARDDRESVPLPATAVERSRSNPTYRRAALALGVLLVIVSGLWVVDRVGFRGVSDNPHVRENPLAWATFTRLTGDVGDEYDGAISPDGRLVSFLSNRNGPYEVFMGPIASSEFRALPHTRLREDVIAPVRTTGFNPGGSEVWFRGGPERGLLTIPIAGGPARPFLDAHVVNVDWSHDGRRIVFHLGTEGDSVFVADGSGDNRRLLLASPRGYHQHYPTWSPDGGWIYLSRGIPTSGDMNLWRVRPDGSELEQLTDDKRRVAYPIPIDAHTVLFCAEESDGAGPWLYAFDSKTGDTRRVSFGVEKYTSLSASADGRRIVATVENPQPSLWSVPLLDRVAVEEDVLPYPLPTVLARAPRFNGDDIFYLSSRGSGDGLWLYTDGQSRELWRGSETALVVPPAVSPDGVSVALVIRRESAQRLHVMSANGAELHALTDEVDVIGSVSWSPDGDWIVAGGTQGGAHGLFRVPIDGGPPTRIAAFEARGPLWSPGGDLIVYAGPQVRALSRLRAVRPDGADVPLPEIRLLRETVGERYRFLPSGRGLVYMQGGHLGQDLFLLDLDTMETRRLTQLEDPSQMHTFDITPDGSTIVFDRLRRNADLVLIELKGGEHAPE